MAGIEKPSKGSKTSSKVEVEMTPEQTKAYGEGRAKTFGDIAAREKADTESVKSFEEVLVAGLQLAAPGSELGEMQREFQRLVRKRAMAEREGLPFEEAFKVNYATTVMVLRNIDPTASNKTIYKQVASI